jgi:adenylate cyclase
MLQAEATRRLRAVLFVDMVDSVRIMSLDEAGTVARWRELMAAVAAVDLPKSGGRRVKLQGDGMLAEFESTVAAVECALAIQSRTMRSESSIDPQRRIRLRMGAHVADVIADEFDIYGDGVNLAARLRDLGGPDEIVVSAAVRDQITDGLGVTVEDLGERRLKGFERPIRAFRAWPPGPVTGPSSDRRRRAGDRPAIAVLPFRSLGNNPRHAFLGDLVADDLIGDLSRLTDLFVISRLSTAPFRDRLFEPRNVAEILGVRYVLSGTMLASDERVRLMAELTEAESGRAIWADRFEGRLADIFALQDQLSTEIAVRVVPMLRRLELRRARAQRPDVLTAYERTLRAIDHLHRSTVEDLEEARALLESAIKSDPNYSAPHAWLGRLHVLRVGQGWSVDPKSDAAEAKRHVDAALESDPQDPWATSVHGLIAAYLDKDLDAALERYERALTVNPSAVSAWAWSASANAWLGNGAKAVSLIQRAIDLSPLDPHMYAFTSIAGAAEASSGNYAAAIAWARRSLRENRMFTSSHRVLTIALTLSGQADEGRKAATELMALEPGLTVGGFRKRYPGSESAHVETFCEALAAAGVPR